MEVSLSCFTRIGFLERNRTDNVFPTTQAVLIGLQCMAWKPALLLSFRVARRLSRRDAKAVVYVSVHVVACG
jgi:hypothetical protein